MAAYSKQSSARSGGNSNCQKKALCFKPDSIKSIDREEFFHEIWHPE